MFTSYLFLISAFLGLAFSLINQFGNKGSNSEKLEKKFRVKKNSFLRKILPFKDTDDSPYLLMKVLPVFIHILVCVITVIVYILFWINPIILQTFLTSTWCYVISLIIALFPLILTAILRI